jgi:heme-degrading monooxygenase HmoA
METRNAARLPAFIVLYRWRLHPGSEDAFVRGWSRMSDLLRQRGSLGSKLHRGSDGLWYSYAQWPSAKAREDVFALGSLDEHASEQMRSAVAERFPEIVLDPVADFLVQAEHGDA